MSKSLTVATLSVALWTCNGLAGAVKGAQVLSPLAFDEDGLPVLEVRLHALGKAGRPLRARFLLDTGAALSVLDASISASYFWPGQGTTRVSDAVGASRDFGEVLLKRVEVAGIVRDAVLAVRMDLRGGMLGRGQDDPVLGILGMNFLSGTRFTYDARRKRVAWWPDPLPAGLTLPLIYSPDRRPGITLSYGTETLPCLVDTGGMGGLDLPWQLRPRLDGASLHATGLLGDAPASGVLLENQQVAAGTALWQQVPVYFQEGTEEARLGQDAWSPVPVCFDFILHRLTWVQAAARELPLKRPVSRSLPVLWDRSGAVPVLTVVEVMPGSAMERAGCQRDDQVLRAGPWRGRGLTRRRLLALMAAGRPHRWLVRRGQALHTLELHTPPLP